MSINFKIFFKEIKDEKVVLAKGDLLEYKWQTLKDKLIENSSNSYFQSKNLIIKFDDIICLDLEGKDKFGLKQDFLIYDNRTFIYLLDKLKNYQKENKDNDIKIKLLLDKRDNEPKIDLENFDICLNESLKKTWKKEKEKIKNELSLLELTNSENSFINQKIIEKQIESMNENQNKIINEKISESQNKEIKFNINENVICNNCLCMNFYGYRYVCSYCNNYNLCIKCYHLGNHDPTHNFILFRTPIEVKKDEDEDILKYDAKFDPSSIVLRNIKEPQPKIPFNLYNTGQKDLKDCYIGCIKLDKNHLWCDRYNITKNIERNSKEEIKLELKYDNEDNNTFNIFEGHFRMFTKNGIPFGDILKIRIINELFD